MLSYVKKNRNNHKINNIRTKYKKNNNIFSKIWISSNVKCNLVVFYGKIYIKKKKTYKIHHNDITCNNITFYKYFSHISHIHHPDECDEL